MLCNMYCVLFSRFNIIRVDMNCVVCNIERVKAVHEEANADLDPSSFTKPKQAMEVAM